MAAVREGSGMSKVAYIGKYLTNGDWHMQLVGYSNGDVSDIYAEVRVVDESVLVSLAEEFLYSIADAKDLDIKPRRNNDS